VQQVLLNDGVDLQYDFSSDDSDDDFDDAMLSPADLKARRLTAVALLPASGERDDGVELPGSADEGDDPDEVVSLVDDETATMYAATVL
jgi:hypothetical protein